MNAIMPLRAARSLRTMLARTLIPLTFAFAVMAAADAHAQPSAAPRGTKAASVPVVDEFMAYAGVVPTNANLLGVGGGVAKLIPLPDAPVSLRIDGSGTVYRSEGTAVIVGGIANALYAFPDAGERRPYVFGGVGYFLFTDASSWLSEPGYQIGGGLHLTKSLIAEIRIQTVGGLNMVPLTLGFRL